MAGGGDESGSRRRSRENGVERAGRSVDENRAALKERTPRPAEMFGREVERRHHARHRVRRGRRGFEAEEGVAVFDYEVAEGAADVDREPHSSLAPKPAGACMDYAAGLG
jgi:hypothetical protein